MQESPTNYWLARGTEEAPMSTGLIIRSCRFDLKTNLESEKGMFVNAIHTYASRTDYSNKVDTKR